MEISADQEKGYFAHTYGFFVYILHNFRSTGLLVLIFQMANIKLSVNGFPQRIYTFVRQVAYPHYIYSWCYVRGAKGAIFKRSLADFISSRKVRFRVKAALEV